MSADPPTSVAGRRQRLDVLCHYLCALAAFASILVLAILLVSLLWQGLSGLSWSFLNNLPSRHAAEAGLRPAIFGTLWLMVLTGLVSVPLGIAAAVYLEEYAPANRVGRLLEINIANLAGVPSIVYGMLGLVLFVRWLHLGRSVLAGALTLSLLILPVLIIASREAIRAVPGTLRTGSLAIGASQWQTIRRVVLPAALPGIATGVILALSRAVGETAPLIMLGALTYVPFVPTRLSSPFTAMPIQIFNWASRPQQEFHAIAASGILVLLAMLLTMNAAAVYLRHRAEQRQRP